MRIRILVFTILFFMATLVSVYANELTGGMIVEQIENMDTEYTYGAKYVEPKIKPEDFDKPITDDTSLIFSNDKEIFNTIIIYIYKNGMPEGGLTPLSHEEIIHVGDRKMVIFKKKDANGNELINWAKWYKGRFYVSISSTNFKMADDTGNLRELKIMADMIDKALDNISGQQDTMETDEEEIITEEFEIVLDVEDNPVTDSDFTGITADSGHSIRINLDLGKGFNGTYKIDDLKYGKLKNQETSKELKGSGTIELEYIPDDYIDGTDKIYTEKIRVTAKSESGATGSDEISLKIQRTPILLVHGFTGDSSTWLKLSEFLKGKGYITNREDYYLDDVNGQSIPAQSKLLNITIDEVKESFINNDLKIKRFDVVAHSMGGLISRYYISRMDEYDDDIRKLIMVGTPNHGCGKLDRIAGYLFSHLTEAHIKAAEQLYSQNPFILDLNRDEKNGNHLNKDVQYAIIYGKGTLLGDGVVTDTSAYLNGVTSVGFDNLTHSPMLSSLGPPITNSDKVFTQIYDWLNSDIPEGRYTSIDMRIYAYEGEAYKQNNNYPGHEGDWVLVDEIDDLIVDEYESLRTGEGKITVILKAGANVFGTVDLDKNTEMYFEYASPHTMRVSLIRGSAKFTTNSGSDKHFETSLEASDSIQVIRGLDTSYVVKADANNQVDCLEGSLEIYNGKNINEIKKATLRKGQSAKIYNDGNFEQQISGIPAWWENGFYDKKGWKYYYQTYKEYVFIVAGALVLIALLITRLIIRKRKRKTNYNK